MGLCNHTLKAEGKLDRASIGIFFFFELGPTIPGWPWIHQPPTPTTWMQKLFPLPTLLCWSDGLADWGCLTTGSGARVPVVLLSRLPHAHWPFLRAQVFPWKSDPILSSYGAERTGKHTTPNNLSSIPRSYMVEGKKKKTPEGYPLMSTSVAYTYPSQWTK